MLLNLPKTRLITFLRLIETFPKQALVFTYLQYKPFENTAGKGEIARNEQFLLFPQSFLPVWRTFCHFHQIQNCRLQTLSVWESLKFVIWERVNKILSQQLTHDRSYMSLASSVLGFGSAVSCQRIL